MASPNRQDESKMRLAALFPENAGCLCATLWALAPFVAGCGTIHKSVDKGDLTKVEEHLQKGIGVDARDEWGRTPLMWSTEDLDVARYLVENGADVNARDADGATPLYYGQATPTFRWATPPYRVLIG